MPGIAAMNFFAVFGPARTPVNVTQRLEKELTAISGLPTFQQEMIQIGALAEGRTGEQLAGFLSRDAEAWQKLIKDAGIKPDD